MSLDTIRVVWPWLNCLSVKRSRCQMSSGSPCSSGRQSSSLQFVPGRDALLSVVWEGDFMERWEVLCVWTERAQLFSSGCMSIHLWELEGGLSGKTLVR